jgi:hypothetical protein
MRLLLTFAVVFANVWKCSAQSFGPQSSANNATSAAESTDSSPSVMMSMLFLAIPVVIGITAMSLLIRKAYIYCNAKQPTLGEDGQTKQPENELITSLKTVDSIEDINFDSPKKQPSTFWILSMPKYTNVAKTETLTPDDEEAPSGEKVDDVSGLPFKLFMITLYALYLSSERPQPAASQCSALAAHLASPLHPREPFPRAYHGQQRAGRQHPSLNTPPCAATLYVHS